MMRNLLLVAFSLALVGLVYTPLLSQTPGIAQDWVYGVVKIKSSTGVTGSGFVVGRTPEGAWLITAEHVVKDAEAFEATFQSDDIKTACEREQRCRAYPGRVNKRGRRTIQIR